MKNEGPYPTTIIRTRYSGVYEGGPWAALDCSFDDVPDAADGSDIECARFWALAHSSRYEINDWVARLAARSAGQSTRILMVGVGPTPDGALSALRARIDMDDGDAP
jgi:hypothetical protein